MILRLAFIFLLLPLAAQACDQLGSDFEFCPEGFWAAADIEVFGDGATFHGDGFDLDYNQPYPGRGTGTIAEDMDAFIDFLDIPVDWVLSTTPLEAEGKTGIIQVVHDRDISRMIAQAIIEIDGKRIMLWVTAPEDTAPEAVTAKLTEAIGALKLT